MPSIRRLNNLLEMLKEKDREITLENVQMRLCTVAQRIRETETDFFCFPVFPEMGPKSELVLVGVRTCCITRHRSSPAFGEHGSRILIKLDIFSTPQPSS